MSVHTSNNLKTVLHMEKRNQLGDIDTAVVAVEPSTVAPIPPEGYAIVATWEEWTCTTCRTKTNNNPAQDEDRYDLHTFIHGHAATR